MTKGQNTKARSLEIYTAAVKFIEDRAVDVTGPVTVRPLAKDFFKEFGCDYGTAKRHIAKAIRRKRGEIVKLHGNWGGPRPNAGRPESQE